MNQRNLAYIGRYNDRRNFPLVDNKLTTKIVAGEAGLAVPDLITVVRTQHEIETIEPVLEGREEFVAKPAQGSGGKGILVVIGRDDDRYVKANGESVSVRSLKRHLTNTISGLHSLGGRSDVDAYVTIRDHSYAAHDEIGEGSRRYTFHTGAREIL